MLLYFLVGIGGMIGAVLRYSIGISVDFWWIFSFPLGTLLANFIGAFSLTYFGQKLTNLSFLSSHMVAAINTGVIGSFTTFSTFSVETMDLIRENEWFVASIYVVFSLIGGLLLSYLGYLVGNTNKKERGTAE